MAFGFPASCVFRQELVGSRSAAREGIVRAFNVLGWAYHVDDVDHFHASLVMNGLSWGETFTVSLGEGAVTVISSCVFPFQVFDWGKNKQNVVRFFAHFSPKEARESVLPSHESLHIDKSGRTPLDRVLAEQRNESPT